MSNQTSPKTAAQLYAEAGLIYIRAPSTVETRANGQKKIKANPFPKPRSNQRATKIQQGKRRLLFSANGSGIPSRALRSPFGFR